MSAVPRADGIIPVERDTPSANNPEEESPARNREAKPSARLARWLSRHAPNLERQLLFVQWALPLILVGIVLVYEVTEHFLLKEETFPSLDFLGEILFFGVLGPIAVWIVMRWIRAEWYQRERDKQALEQMYNELSRVQRRLDVLNRQRGELLNRLMCVPEEERRRLAREIHDELGQLLTGLSLNLKLCQDVLPEEFRAAHEYLTKANALVRHTIEQSHRIIADLRPPILDDYGLVPALQEELAQRLNPLNIEAYLEANGDLEHLPVEVATAAFRIVQEAITNIIRHAHAQQVCVKLAQENDGLTAIVEDDGVGIPQVSLDDLNAYPSLGILGMQERARSLGGWLRIGPREPHGTRVQLWLPLQREKV